MSASPKCNVVYWLGAGASARALPIVGEMQTAFTVLASRIGSAGGSTMRYSEFTRRLSLYGQHASQFGTIDTYARSLFLRKEVDALRELKLHLSMYFVLEQILRAPYGREGGGYFKSDHIDTRYMGWLAVLLRAPQQTAGNVNVISWNYDLQIEHALAIYGNSPSLGIVHQNPDLPVYPDHRREASAKSISYRPFLIHLNGVAGVLEGLRDSVNYLHDNILNHDQGGQLDNLIGAYDTRGTGTPSLLDRVDELFTFAWEETTTSKAGMKMAGKYLMEADELVIIGYSFPSFNRRYDRDLLANFLLPMNRRSSKRIVVQNPTMSKEDFVELFPQVIPRNVKVASDVGQFHLPPVLL